MTSTPQQPNPLEARVANLENNMTDLRAAAEALLQTAQIHQLNIESIRQRQIESDQRFEIMLAELRQLKIESDARFNGLQTEIQRVIDKLFNQQDN